MRFDTPIGVQRINRSEAEEEREAFFDSGAHSVIIAIHLPLNQKTPLFTFPPHALWLYSP
jgi:hypothetical protein